MKHLPIIISIISLIISLLTIWFNLFRPAKIKIIPPNRISISSDPFTPLQGTYAISVTFNTVNSGPNAGVVEDLLLILNNSQTKTTFRPVYEFINKLNSFSSKEIGSPDSKEFNSFIVNEKESLIKTVVFRQNDLSIPLNLTPQQYKLTIYSKIDNNKEFKKSFECHLSLGEDDIKEINKKTVTPQNDGRNYIQISETNKPTVESESLRNSFIKELNKK